MTVNSTTSTSSNPPADTSSSRVVQKQLGQADFLKLLTVQLAHQDPMKPMDDNSFIAQMAQFSSLQQTTEMVNEFGLLRYSSDISSASNLLGRTVTVTGEKGNVTGLVSGVDATDGTPRIEVGGDLYGLTSILQIETTAPEPEAVPAA